MSYYKIGKRKKGVSVYQASNTTQTVYVDREVDVIKEIDRPVVTIQYVDDEVPVEVIREVEKLVYVDRPVEVIREVQIEKVVEIIKEVKVDVTTVVMKIPMWAVLALIIETIGIITLILTK